LKATIALKGANRTVLSDSEQTRKFPPFNFTTGTDIDLSPAMQSDGGKWELFGSPDRAQTVSDVTIGSTSIQIANSPGEAGIRYIPQNNGDAIIPVGDNDVIAPWFWMDYGATNTAPFMAIEIYNPVSDVNPTPSNNGLRITSTVWRQMRTGFNCMKLPPTDMVGNFPGLRGDNGSGSAYDSWSEIGSGFDNALGIAEIRILANGTNRYIFELQMNFCGITIGYRQPPVVMLTFDDNWANLYTVKHDDNDDLGPMSSFERARSLGIPAVVSCIRDKVRNGITDGGLNEAQIAEMVAGGWEFNTHGSNVIRQPIAGPFTSEEMAVNDGYGQGEGGYIEGDSIRYNQEWLEQMGIDPSTRRGYTFPTNNNRSDGKDWQLGIMAEAEPYLDFLGTSSPPFQCFDKLPIQGNQNHAWGSWSRISIENPANGTLTEQKNNMILQAVSRMGQAANLYAHRAITGGTGGLPPGGSSYYIEDFTNLLKWLAEKRDEGLFEIMTPTTYYKRMIASGVPAGLN